jgi:hypothetical protein
MFARGDGSVHSISKNVTPSIICALTRVDEGTSWNAINWAGDDSVIGKEERED